MIADGKPWAVDFIWSHADMSVRDRVVEAWFNATFSVKRQLVCTIEGTVKTRDGELLDGASHGPYSDELVVKDIVETGRAVAWVRDDEGELVFVGVMTPYSIGLIRTIWDQYLEGSPTALDTPVRAP